MTAYNGNYPAGVNNATFSPSEPPLIIHPCPPPSAFHDAFAETGWKGDLVIPDAAGCELGRRGDTRS
jgi:hypothetical protein